MTYTPIPKGTADWDVPVNAAFVDQDTRITSLESRTNALEDPQVSSGVIGWTYDPVMASGSTNPGTNGTVYMFKMRYLTSGIVNNILFSFSAGGSGFTAGQNFAGLYDSGGNLIAQTADQSVNWTGTGKITCPLTAPVFVSGGSEYYVAMLFNATTRPAVMRTVSLANTADVVNLNQTSATYSFSTSGAGLTALPSTVDMNTRTANVAAWWAAIL